MTTTGPEPSTPAVLGLDGATVAARPFGREVWRRFRHNRLAVVGLALIGILVLLALLAPLIAPYDPIRDRTSSFRSPPSRDHLFGTDNIGRDLFSRVLYGARISLRVGFLATLLSLGIGVTLGAIAGYFGGLVDGLVMRLTDVLLAIPYVVLAVAIATVFGRSEQAIILVLGLTGWLAIVRIVRANVLALKELEYVEAARALGYPRRRIIFRHILPNTLQPIVVYGTISVGTVILAEAALSYLGVGPQAPSPSWGLMVAESQGTLSSAPHLLFFPGGAIFLTVLSFVFVGDGLHDALDPKLT